MAASASAVARRIKMEEQQQPQVDAMYSMSLGGSRSGGKQVSSAPPPSLSSAALAEAEPSPPLSTTDSSANSSTSTGTDSNSTASVSTATQANPPGGPASVSAAKGAEMVAMGNNSTSGSGAELQQRLASSSSIPTWENRSKKRQPHTTVLPVALQDHLVTSKEQLLRRLTRERDAPVDTEKEKEEQQQEFVLIMGNDAGDLDSVVSAICLAYLLTLFPNALSEATSGVVPTSTAGSFSGAEGGGLSATPPLPSQPSSATKSKRIYVPLIQQPRHCAHLRPENELMLQTVLGDSTSIFRREEALPCLLWLDEVQEAVRDNRPIGKGKNEDGAEEENVLATSDRLSPKNGIRFGLVDHNTLSPLWRSSSGGLAGGTLQEERSIALIIDHHADEGSHLDAPLRWIMTPDTNPTGSCASLVTLLFAKYFQEDLKAVAAMTPAAVAQQTQQSFHAQAQRKKAMIPMSIADLLLGPIAVDTDNLKGYIPRTHGAGSDAPAGLRSKASMYDAMAYQLLYPLSSFGEEAARARIWSTVSILLPRILPSELITPALFEDLGAAGELDGSAAAGRGQDKETSLLQSVLSDPEPDLAPPMTPASDGRQNLPLLSQLLATPAPTLELISTLRQALDASWKALSLAKGAAIYSLVAKDFLRRDCKILSVRVGTEEAREPMQVDGPAHGAPAVKAALASIPTSLSALVYGYGKKPLSASAGVVRDNKWQAWWTTLDAFMRQHKLDVALCLMSFREVKSHRTASAGAGVTQPKDKHARELLIAVRGSNTCDAPPAVFTNLTEGLETESYIAQGTAYRDAPTSPLRLMLEKPWRGQRIPETGKKDRLAGLDSLGRWQPPATVAGAPGDSLWVAVYRQGNDKANRKVVLPAVLSVLQHSS